MGIRCIALLAVCFAAIACTEVVEVPVYLDRPAGVAGSGGDAQPGGSGGTVAEGGSGGIGAGGSGGAIAEPVLCTERACRCTQDCCSWIETIDSESIGNDEWVCPAGYVEWETCDPSMCACDVAEKKHCVSGGCCRGDVIVDSLCTPYGWVCDGGTQDFDECPSVECSCDERRYYPGDTCDERGNMRCEIPVEEFEGLCNLVVCQTCEGFEGPVAWDGCTCVCEEVTGGAQVVCEPTE